MKAVLQEVGSEIISAKELNIGDYAVIISHSTIPNSPFVGHVIRRTATNNDFLVAAVCITDNRGDVWTHKDLESVMVKKLKPGTKLVIQN